MRRRLDHGRCRLPKEGAEERGYVLRGGQSEVSAVVWAPCAVSLPRLPAAPLLEPAGAVARCQDPPIHTQVTGWTESCRTGHGLLGHKCPRDCPCEPCALWVGWDCLPWLTPTPPSLVPRAWVRVGTPGSCFGRCRRGPMGTDSPAVHPSEQPELSASTCPRITLRTGTVQVGAREAGLGRDPSATLHPNPTVPCSRPGPAWRPWGL